MSNRQQETTNGEGAAGETYFEGYTDYSSVSKDIAEAVARAVEGYGYVVGRERYDRKKLDKARHSFLSAAMRLLPEIEESKAAKPELQEIHDRWVGSEERRGIIKKLEEEKQVADMPNSELQEFTFDIRKAAFKLGYLKAGEERNGGSTDVDDKQSEQMFDNL